jgi:hypothetical protein
MISARISGPLVAAFKSWAKASSDLAGAGHGLFSSFEDHALCVSQQIGAAVGMLNNIQLSIDVQIEVSASMSASAGG